MRTTPAFGMSRRQQLFTYAILLLVAASGLAWIALGWGVDTEDFNSPLRLWRHRILVLHGIAAYGLLWLAGTLYSRHQQMAWRAHRNRPSGALLSAALLLLAVGGLTLYYPPDEDWRDTLSALHQGLGLALPVLTVLHVVIGRRARRLMRRPWKIPAAEALLPAARAPAAVTEISHRARPAVPRPGHRNHATSR